MANNKYDWKILKVRFMNDPKPDLGLREFARKQGINENTLLQRAREDGWVEARAEKYSILTDKVASEIIEYEADRVKKIRSRVFDIVDAYLDGLDANLSEDAIEKIQSLSVKDIATLVKMVKPSQISSIKQDNTYNFAGTEKDMSEMDDEELANYYKSTGNSLD